MKDFDIIKDYCISYITLMFMTNHDCQMRQNDFAGFFMESSEENRIIFKINKYYDREIEIIFDFINNKNMQNDLKNLAQPLDITYKSNNNITKLYIKFDSTTDRNKSINELITSLY